MVLRSGWLTKGGGRRGVAVQRFVFFRGLRDDNALKSFSFLTRQYFMTSGKKGQGWVIGVVALRLWPEQLGVATHWHIAGLCH